MTTTLGVSSDFYLLTAGHATAGVSGREAVLTPLCECGVSRGLNGHGSAVTHSGCWEIGETRLPCHGVCCGASTITERSLDHRLQQQEDFKGRKSEKKNILKMKEYINKQLYLQELKKKTQFFLLLGWAVKL